MAHWLLKTEPGTYSFADLAKAGTTLWDGVSNPMALKNLRAMSLGDDLAIYHTGGEKAVVGLARVARAAQLEPRHEGGKLAAVEIEAGPALAVPVTLAALRQEDAFAGSDLLRIPRLSVVPLSPKQWTRIQQLGRAPRG